MRSRLKQVSVKFSAPAFGAAMLMFTSGCALPWSVPRYRHSCSLTEQETRETALHLQAELFREYEISTYFDECNDGRSRGIWLHVKSIDPAKKAQALRSYGCLDSEDSLVCRVGKTRVEVTIDGDDAWLVLLSP